MATLPEISVPGAAALDAPPLQAPLAQPAPPPAPPAAPADPFAGLEEVSAEEATGAMGEFAGLEEVDALEALPVEQLNADRDTFDPVQYFSSNPDVARDPKKLEKLLAVYRQRDKEGLDAGQVLKAAVTEGPATVGKIFGGLRDAVAGAINVGLQPAVNVVGGVLTGDVFDKQRREALMEETRKVQKKGIAEFVAGTETSATGLSDLARTGLRKFEELNAQAAASQLGEEVGEKTDQQLLNQLAESAAFREQMAEVASGRGETLKAVGLDADTLAQEGITLDPEVIERLSLVDPLTIVAGAGGFQVVNSAGKVLISAATRQAAEETLGRILAKGVTAIPRAGGKALEKTGQAVQGISRRVGPSDAALGSMLATAASGINPAAGAIGFGARLAAPAVGRATSAVGRAAVRATDTIANSATFQKALTGAAEGAAAGAPLAALAEDDTTAGAIIGAGATLGAGARGVITGAGAPGRAISRARLAPKEGVFAQTSSKSYGIEPNFDAAHAEAIKTLPQDAQNTINSLREATRELGAEIYSLQPEVYEQSLLEHAERAKGAPLTAAEIAEVRNVSDTQGYFDVSLTTPEGTPRRVVFLNSAGDAPHEVGHLFNAVLSPERSAELLQAARESYTPEQIAQYKADYQQRLGRTVSDDAALNEIIAENFSQLLRNTPIRQLSTPPGLLQEIGNTLVNFAEEAGLDLTAGTKTPAGAPSSLRFNDAVRNAAREVLQPRPAEPAPARPTQMTLSEAARELGDLVEPTTPTPLVTRRQAAPRDFPVVSSEEAAGVAVVEPRAPRTTRARARETAAVTEEATRPEVVEAQTLAAEAPAEVPVGGTRLPRELLGQIAESIATQEGVKLNYLSAPGEPAAAITSNRTTRRAIIEAFRDMPPEARALWEKTFFPEKVTRTQSGNYQIQGWAPEVFASNAHKLAKFLAETPEAQSLSPYAVDPNTKTFTPEAWQELYRDTQTFVQNQMRGATGSGEPLVVPRSVTEAGGFAPAVRAGARALDQTKADFINALFNFKLPETPRMQRGRRPLNVMGQEVSAATMPGRVESPVRPRGEFTGEEAVAQGIEGVSIAEVNPLRNQLEAAALAAKKPMPSFIEVIQKLNLENIKEIQGVPEQPQFRGNTLTLSAGFQPRDWRVTGQKGGQPAEVVVRAEDIAAARRMAQDEGLSRVTRVETADLMENAMFQAAASPVETVDMVKAMSPAEFMEWSRSLPTSLTGEALSLGRAAPDQAFVADLKTQYEAIGPKAMVALRAMKFDDASAISAQAQFFKEAYEAATGTGGVGKSLKAADPDYAPPFPQFQAKAAPKGVAKPAASATFTPMPQAEAERIADAIYVAEGGAKAKKPYGILSVKVANEAEARRVAVNTIRNNWKRWHDAGKPGEYLEFLAKRYAPVGAENDPQGLNKNWLKNVRAGLAKTKK